MSGELMPGARIPSTQLTGEAERTYVRRLRRILRRARLNLYYPESRAMGAHIEALSPEIHQGLYEGVEVHLTSGLPTYKEWTRVQTDVTLAADQLRQLGPRQALADKAQGVGPDSPHTRQLRKHDYYSALVGRPLAPLGDMDVSLRRVDPATNTAWFHVVLDKLDASGLFVRYAIDLSQRASAWSEPVVTLDEETAQHTEAFQSLIYKFTSLDAEFTHAKLAGIGGLEVERVAKGTVGPFYFAAEQAPPELRELLEGEGSYLAMFALDLVALDQAEDRDNDPLDDFFTEKLSVQAQRGYEMARERHGYHRYKDRKFVVPRQLVDPLRRFCAERGTKNIIYPA